ncbi:MAG: hypothetical protein RBR50_08130 [Candidatus Izemoplasmatales bacterium]|jgi:hypothetical protein|nr:hypothetical protein [Candidatus Izemoplasmatales bacterium]
MKNLDKLTKRELIKILKTILKDHPEYFSLIKEVKITSENPDKVLKAIEKEVANHTGSVLKAYQIYQGYKTNHSKSKSFMGIAYEFVCHLFVEIDLYGGEPTEELLDIALEVFEDACCLAAEHKDASIINSLYESLHSSIYNDDIIEDFHDIMSFCGGFELLDD